jgi:hypothetical protein
LRPIVGGLGIALLGAIMVAAGTIAFSCAYVGSWLTTTVFSVLCVATGLGFKVLYARFMRSLGADKEESYEVCQQEAETAQH